MKTRVLRYAIENLAAWHPYLYVEPYVVAFVAVTGQYSRSPASFRVECQGVKSRWLGKSRELALAVSWSEDTIDKAERLRATMPTRSLVELAAVSVALARRQRAIPRGAPSLVADGGH